MTSPITTETRADKLKVGDYIRFNTRARVESHEVIELDPTNTGLFIRILAPNNTDEWLQAEPTQTFYKLGGTE